MLDDIKKLSQTNVELSSSWIFTNTFKRSLNKISDIFFQENGSQIVVCGLHVVCGHFVQPLMCLPHIYIYVCCRVAGLKCYVCDGDAAFGNAGDCGDPYDTSISEGALQECNSTEIFCRVCAIWWRRDMGMISASLALCVGNPPVTDGFPSQRARKCGCFMSCLLSSWKSCRTEQPVEFPVTWNEMTHISMA